MQLRTPDFGKTTRREGKLDANAVFLSILPRRSCDPNGTVLKSEAWRRGLALRGIVSPLEWKSEYFIASRNDLFLAGRRWHLKSAEWSFRKSPVASRALVKSEKLSLKAFTERKHYTWCGRNGFSLSRFWCVWQELESGVVTGEACFKQRNILSTNMIWKVKGYKS